MVLRFSSTCSKMTGEEPWNWGVFSRYFDKRLALLESP